MLRTVVGVERERSSVADEKKKRFRQDQNVIDRSQQKSHDI
jgi:hypothetical protein